MAAREEGWVAAGVLGFWAGFGFGSDDVNSTEAFMLAVAFLLVRCVK